MTDDKLTTAEAFSDDDIVENNLTPNNEENKEEKKWNKKLYATLQKRLSMEWGWYYPILDVMILTLHCNK